MINIESNIPLIERVRIDYPFEGMKVGDSFLVEGKDHRTRIGSAMVYHAKKLGTKYTQRKVEGGIRVWRIK